MSVRPIVHRAAASALTSQVRVQRQKATGLTASEPPKEAQADVPDPSRAGFIPTPASVPSPDRAGFIPTPASLPDPSRAGFIPTPASVPSPDRAGFIPTPASLTDPQSVNGGNGESGGGLPPLGPIDRVATLTPDGSGGQPQPLPGPAPVTRSQ